MVVLRSYIAFEKERQLFIHPRTDSCEIQVGHAHI